MPRKVPPRQKNIFKGSDRPNRQVDPLIDQFRGISVKDNPNPRPRCVSFATNYVAVHTSDVDAYKYSVSFSPSIDSTGLRYKLLCQYDSLFGEFKLFDGTTLYLPNPIKQQHAIQIKIRFLERVFLSECHHLISIILKRVLKHIKLQRIGNGFYCSNLKIDLNKNSISLWPGFTTSLHVANNTIYWNINSSFKLFRKECVLDIMANIYSNCHDFCRDTERAILGSVVITRYNNKTYKIDDIAWNKSPRDTFEWKNGQQISFIDYYREIYGLEITDTDQPLLINLPKRSKSNALNCKKTLDLICLIPEFCFLTGLTDEMRNDWRLMKDLNRHLHLSPHERLKTIHSLVTLIHRTPEAMNELHSWGLDLSTSLCEIQGSILPPEQVFDKKPEPLISDGKTLWQNKLSTIHPISTPYLQDWVCIYQQRDAAIVNDFMIYLEQASRQCSLKFDPPKLISLHNDSTDTYIKAIRNELSLNPEIGLIMSIFPSQREDRYAAFKKFLCCHTAIPSQAILTKTISNKGKLASVATRIALQMNCKVGGELWRVKIPLSNVMVVGIDVYHCTHAGNRNSVVGFVSSFNNILTRWLSQVSFQPQSNEFAECISLFLSQALLKYQEVNNTLPKHIIFFRDGVSRSQFNVVKTIEIEQIHNILERIYEGSIPQIIYTVICKRINTRYFSNNNGKFDNPPSGSVISDSITISDFPNFFLVSQNFGQGTMTPINVIVLYNSSFLNIEQIQRFTYKCTFLHYNWPGTVTLPAPCLYAHKVAFMAGQYLHAQPSKLLSTTLYFL